MQPWHLALTAFSIVTLALSETTEPKKQPTAASKGKAAAPKAKTAASKSKATAETTPKTAAPKTKPAASSPADSDATPSATSPESTPPSPPPESTAEQPSPPGKKHAEVSTLLPEEIAGFEGYPDDLQNILRKALALTTQNLRYQFGSSDPKQGGMDCSGTMFRVLTDSGLKDVPRQSDEFCHWVMRQTVLYRTEDVTSLKDPAFSALKPGDLLFWTGTYETGTARELPISHVMIYLGKRKKDGKPVVFGASDGRTYDNQRRNGVSVFDFALPARGKKSEFYGYGPVPGIELSARKPASPPE